MKRCYYCGSPVQLTPKGRIQIHEHPLHRGAKCPARDQYDADADLRARVVGYFEGELAPPDEPPE